LKIGAILRGLAGTTTGAGTGAAVGASEEGVGLAMEGTDFVLTSGDPLAPFLAAAIQNKNQ